MNKLAILSLLLPAALAACVPTPPVTENNDGTYTISQTGGWGYDMHDVKTEVKQQANQFARQAGKDLVILNEEVRPMRSYGTYPSYDDTYTLTFRLGERTAR